MFLKSFHIHHLYVHSMKHSNILSVFSNPSHTFETLFKFLSSFQLLKNRLERETNLVEQTGFCHDEIMGNVNPSAIKFIQYYNTITVTRLVVVIGGVVRVEGWLIKIMLLIFTFLILKFQPLSVNNNN